MPVRYAIDHANRFVEAAAEGHVTLKDIEAFMDDVVRQDALTYRKLFDASEASGSYTDDDVMTLAARAAAYAQLAERGPLALVPRRGAVPDLAKRYVNLGKFTGQAKIFESAAEALAWLATQKDEPSVPASGNPPAPGKASDGGA